jgi:hypothetical protein
LCSGASRNDRYTMADRNINQFTLKSFLRVSIGLGVTSMPQRFDLGSPTKGKAEAIFSEGD